MISGFFYLFAAIAVVGAICLVAFRNPVSSAMAMVASFLGLAALFVGLNAYFVGIIQILVYAGAIMVLFLFIIMLLDLKLVEKMHFKPALLLPGLAIPLLFLFQLLGVIPNVQLLNRDGDHPDRMSSDDPKPLALKESAAYFHDEEKKESEQSEIYKSLSEDSLPDVNLIGLTMFGHKGDNASMATPGYNFPLQMIGVLLLVATVGVVALSLKKRRSEVQVASSEGEKS